LSNTWDARKENNRAARKVRILWDRGLPLSSEPLGQRWKDGDKSQGPDLYFIYLKKFINLSASNLKMKV
jgi:hypothetical protein